MQRAAFQYVEAVNKTHAFLRPEWLAGLDPSKTLLAPRLKWFPLQPQKNRRTPPGVLWLDRYESAGSANPQVCIDRTALLLAGFFLDEKDEFEQDIPLLGGQGLSVIVHLDKLESGRARVRITGLFNTVPMALDEDVTARVFADLQRLVNGSASRAISRKMRCTSLGSMRRRCRLRKRACASRKSSLSSRRPEQSRPGHTLTT